MQDTQATSLQRQYEQGKHLCQSIANVNMKCMQLEVRLQQNDSTNSGTLIHDQTTSCSKA